MTWTAALLLLMGTARAQDDGGSRLDRIEVTGSSLSYDELLGTPAIAITRPGGPNATATNCSMRSQRMRAA